MKLTDWLLAIGIVGALAGIIVLTILYAHGHARGATP